MDTNNEKTIAELIQELSDAVLDCLQKTNGDGVCYIDETINFPYYLEILFAICEKKRIQLDASTIKDCFVQANEKAAEQYKETFVSRSLEEYFNRWTFTLVNGERVTVPYFMKTNDRINKRKKQPEVKNILNMTKTISQKWAAGIKKSEYDCQSYNIGDDVNLGKGSPEMIQYVVNQMLDLYSIYSKSIENMSEEYISSFNDFGFNKKTINSVMNVLSEKLENAQQFMEDYGIGVDCSGFVSRALATIFEKTKIDKNVQMNCLGEASEKGCVRTNMSHFELTDENWEKKKKTSIKFSDIKVGDFFLSKTHVKIVNHVERDKDNSIISYTTMESSPTTSSKNHNNAERLDILNNNLSGLVKFKKQPVKDGYKTTPHLAENESIYMLFRTQALDDYYNN